MANRKLIWASAVFAAFAAVAAVKDYNASSRVGKAPGFNVSASLEDRSEVSVKYSPKTNQATVSATTSINHEYVKGVRLDFLENYAKSQRRLDLDFTLNLFNKKVAWRPTYDLNTRTFYVNGFYKI
jgi:hypothetical protein